MRTVLDNAVWEALSSRQAHLNTGNNAVKYFAADVAPFVGMEHWDANDLALLQEQLPRERSFSVLIAKPVQLPASCKVIFSTPLYQMHCPVLKPYPVKDTDICKLGPGDLQQMLDLTALTKPGPFFSRTMEFGNYYGIFSNGKLAAMAGERLKAKGCTEVSAICTDPAFTGKGYAAALLSKVAAEIIADGCIPFLHVRSDNTRAIDLYQRSGFAIRADVHFAIFKAT